MCSSTTYGTWSVTSFWSQVSPCWHYLGKNEPNNGVADPIPIDHNVWFIPWKLEITMSEMGQD